MRTQNPRLEVYERRKSGAVSSEIGYPVSEKLNNIDIKKKSHRNNLLSVALKPKFHRENRINLKYSSSVSGVVFSDRKEVAANRQYWKKFRFNGRENKSDVCTLLRTTTVVVHVPMMASR
ncbi:Hypothetical protein CINCED_3A003543 [Cinara cedri]|uniref:Uncharacterized protein n=1 Tax=Cinara cedri TaxID=506608 RepID=A0A5E4MV48_9HEMI|nr:Hypothetical protein CINCED_3A003543 [Cinara cedri]